MSLNRRQQRLYKCTCDIYVPLIPGSTGQRLPNNDIRSLCYPPTPTYTDQKFFFQAFEDIGKGTFYGRAGKNTSPSELDIGHFDCALTLMTQNTIIHYKSSPAGTIDEWYLCAGDNQQHASFIGNMQVFELQRTIKGKGIT